VAVDSQDNVYVADSEDNLIEKLSPAGTPLATWRGAGGRPFVAPAAVTVDGGGNIYVAEGAGRVDKLSPSGQSLAPWGTGDSGPATLVEPLALALDSGGDLWLFGDDEAPSSSPGSPYLLEYSPSGKLILQARLEAFNVGNPGFGGLAFDGRGHIDVTQEVSGRGAGSVVKVYSITSLSGTYVNKPISTLGRYGGRRDPFRQFGGIAFDRRGDAYIADTYNDQVRVLSPSGAVLFAAGQYGARAGEFSRPSGIAVDGRGNVYVADTNNNRVQKLVPQRTRP
jgi:sugar lactone lactonase YvrE